MNQARIQTNTYLVNRDAALAGVGETGVPPICNAIFAATGKPIRELPIGRHMAGGAD